MICSYLASRPDSKVAIYVLCNIMCVAEITPVRDNSLHTRVKTWNFFSRQPLMKIAFSILFHG